MKTDEVAEYINRQKSPQKEILKKLRKIILSTFPKINKFPVIDIMKNTPAVNII